MALKFLPEALARNRQTLERFRREARSASALNHPHICTLHDIDEAAGEPFLVMELLDGETLQTRLAAGPLPIRDAVTYGMQVADALDAAHAKSIVHRDLKPANIFLTPHGVKVLDFGLARSIADLTPATHAPSPDMTTLTELTTPGSTIGTIAYMSPEQARGEPIDARTDVFALGVVLYQMVTGRLPFEGRTAVALMHSIVHNEPAALHAIRHDVPLEVERIILRALEKQREKRYQSAAAVLEDLKTYHATLSASQEAGEPALRVVGRQLRRPIVAASTVALVLLILAGATVGLRRYAHVRWARDVALPEIVRLADKGEIGAAFRLARQAERYIPGDPLLRKQVQAMSLPFPIRTEPTRRCF